MFLTLRDPSADMSVTSPAAPGARRRRAPLTEGARVVVHAKPRLLRWPRARSRSRADEIRPVGLGELLARLEQLQRGARRGGAVRRRPQAAAAVPAAAASGSSAGARSAPSGTCSRTPADAGPASSSGRDVAVQGPTRCREVIDAVRAAGRDPEVDVIVVTRGGGSVEDLLPFSDEGLVRAVAACRTPVVSAIGHEQDAPLLDLVADVRASTPTDAARGSCPTWPRSCDAHRAPAGPRPGRRRGTGRPRQHRLDTARARPVLADPPSSSTAASGAPRSSGRGPALLRTGWTGPATRWATWARVVRSPPRPPSSAATPSCSAGRGRRPRPGRRTAGQAVRVRVAVGDFEATRTP